METSNNVAAASASTPSPSVLGNALRDDATTTVRQHLTLLRRLSVRGRALVRGSGSCVSDGAGWTVVDMPDDAEAGAEKSGRSGQAASERPIPEHVVRELLAAGLIAPRSPHAEWHGQKDRARAIYRLTPEGRLALKRALSGGEAASAHRELAERAREAVSGSGQTHSPRQDTDAASPGSETPDLSRLLVNLAESPLTWLARRKDRQGKPMLQLHQIVAGERLRRDYEFAGLRPQVSSGWQVLSAGGGGKGGGAGGAVELSDQVIAARQRLTRLLDGMPPVLAAVSVDVCCHLKGLEIVEAERGWPARSAKIVLQIALSCLADAYGLRVEGPARSRSRHWRSSGEGLQ